MGRHCEHSSHAPAHLPLPGRLQWHHWRAFKPRKIMLWLDTCSCLIALLINPRRRLQRNKQHAEMHLSVSLATGPECLMSGALALWSLHHVILHFAPVHTYLREGLQSMYMFCIWLQALCQTGGAMAASPVFGPCPCPAPQCMAHCPLAGGMLQPSLP